MKTERVMTWWKMGMIPGTSPVREAKDVVEITIPRAEAAQLAARLVNFLAGDGDVFKVSVMGNLSEDVHQTTGGDYRNPDGTEAD